MSDLSPFKRNKVLGQSFNAETYRFSAKNEGLKTSQKSKVEASLVPLPTDATEPIIPSSQINTDPVEKVVDPGDDPAALLISNPPQIPFVSANREDLNAGLRLSVVLLRLQLGSLSSQNKTLRSELGKKREGEVRYSKRLMELAGLLEDLHLNERLDQEKPSELLKPDIIEIDDALTSISRKLEAVTGDSGQDNYLTQVIAKKRDFYAAAVENEEMLEKLCENVAKFKNTVAGVGKLAERV
jgi:hypothetical protein